MVRKVLPALRLRRKARAGDMLSETVGISVTHRTLAGKMPIDAGNSSNAGISTAAARDPKKPHRPALHYWQSPPLLPSAMLTHQTRHLRLHRPMRKKRFYLHPARSRAPLFSASETEKVNVYRGL